MNETEQCPCGSEKSFQLCCGPYLAGESSAPDPLALMRSRYTAFTRGEVRYLATTHPGHTDPKELAALKAWTLSVQWTGLEVVESSSDDAETGYVEFKAHFIHEGQKDFIHERSRFQKKQGIWYYIDGKAPKQTPLRVQTQERNQPCACGSGIKYKKCCGKTT